jgi:hypothetical protein
MQCIWFYRFTFSNNYGKSGFRYITYNFIFIK